MAVSLPDVSITMVSFQIIIGFFHILDCHAGFKLFDPDHIMFSALGEDIEQSRECKLVETFGTEIRQYQNFARFSR